MFYQWNPGHIRAPRWMAFVCYSAERNRYLYAAFPLNLVLAVVWWAQDRWARKANTPSWIEREVEARSQRRDSTIRRG